MPTNCLSVLKGLIVASSNTAGEKSFSFTIPKARNLSFQYSFQENWVVAWTFQPTFEHFSANTFDYGSSECGHISKHRYPAEITSNDKGNLHCRNASNRLGLCCSGPISPLSNRCSKEFLVIPKNILSRILRCCQHQVTYNFS